MQCYIFYDWTMSIIKPVLCWKMVFRCFFSFQIHWEVLNDSKAGHTRWTRSAYTWPRLRHDVIGSIFFLNFSRSRLVLFTLVTCKPSYWNIKLIWYHRSEAWLHVTWAQSTNRGRGKWWKKNSSDDVMTEAGPSGRRPNFSCVGSFIRTCDWPDFTIIYRSNWKLLALPRTF